MKIWITGISGFLGSHLARVLIDRGHTVGGNDSLICGDYENVPAGAYFKHFKCQDREKFRFYWQTTDKDAFGVPDVLVHCAATAHEGLSVFAPHFITENIFEASTATFSAAIGCGVKKIINMSSMARYGAERTPFTEETRPNPVDPYGIAKLAAERVLAVLCRQHGVRHTNLVPHNIIGVGQRYVDPYRNVASIMINRVKQGKPVVIYGDGAQRRCFSPIDDVLDCIVRTVEQDFDGETINIGPDGKGITINELADMVFDVCGVNTGIEYFPDRPCEVKTALCSSDKARRLLGYREIKPVRECLAEMAAAIQPKEFDYKLPLEIITDRTPKTWLNKLI